MPDNARPDGNHHKGLVVVDSITGLPFAVEGVSDDGSVNVNVTGGSESQPTSSTPTSVGDTTTSTQLIAANPNRLEVEFYNDSSAALYLLKGTGTASASNKTAILYKDDYYRSRSKVAFQGVWASDAGGIVNITEST